jgi:hypothetical protein
MQPSTDQPAFSALVICLLPLQTSPNIQQPRKRALGATQSSTAAPTVKKKIGNEGTGASVRLCVITTHVCNILSSHYHLAVLAHALHRYLT